MYIRLNDRLRSNLLLELPLNRSWLTKSYNFSQLFFTPQSEKFRWIGGKALSSYWFFFFLISHNNKSIPVAKGDKYDPFNISKTSLAELQNSETVTRLAHSATVELWNSIYPALNAINYVYFIFVFACACLETKLPDILHKLKNPAIFCGLPIHSAALHCSGIFRTLTLCSVGIQLESTNKSRVITVNTRGGQRKKTSLFKH